MKYQYVVYDLKKDPVEKVLDTTRFEELENYLSPRIITGLCTHVLSMTKAPPLDFIRTLETRDDYEGWRAMLEREYAWIPGVGKKGEELAINQVGIGVGRHSPLPSHEPHQQVEDDGFTTCYPNCTRTVFEGPLTVRQGESVRIDADGKPSVIKSSTAIDEWEEYLKNSKPSNIDPPHYQNYLSVELPTASMDYQWLETMCRIERYRNNPEHFIAALEFQVRKYLDRKGKKDDDLQELQKGLWYYKFMVAYIKNGNKPIYVRDVDLILARK